MCIPLHTISRVKGRLYKLHLSAVGDISGLQTAILLPVPTRFSNQTFLHYPKVANLHQVLLGLLDQGVVIPVLVVNQFHFFFPPNVFTVPIHNSPQYWISSSWFIWIQKFCMEFISVIAFLKDTLLTSVAYMYYSSSEFLSFHHNLHKMKDRCSSLTLKLNPTPNT